MYMYRAKKRLLALGSTIAASDCLLPLSDGASSSLDFSQLYRSEVLAVVLLDIDILVPASRENSEGLITSLHGTHAVGRVVLNFLVNRCD